MMMMSSNRRRKKKTRERVCVCVCLFRVCGACFLGGGLKNGLGGLAF